MWRALHGDIAQQRRRNVDAIESYCTSQLARNELSGLVYMRSTKAGRMKYRGGSCESTSAPTTTAAFAAVDKELDIR